jgi:hypothetical protein
LLAALLRCTAGDLVAGDFGWEMEFHILKRYESKSPSCASANVSIAD